MKVAAIDIGSNSIHLIVVDVYPDGHYTVIDKAKDMVGLARHTLANGYLSDKAIERGLKCLKTFKRMCSNHGVSTIKAVATSAVREAVNGEHFVEKVREECGIDVEVITGREEAMLIYLGCREHIDWAERRALIVDIGGGSAEFIVGDEDKGEVFVSLLLGVRRLSEMYLVGDPPRKAELKELKAGILEGLSELQEGLAGLKFDFVVGTSGTLNNLAQMAARRNDFEPAGSHGLWTSLQELKEMGRALSGLRESERRAYHGVDPKRVDTIVAGAQLIKYILRAVEKDTYVACDFALRDGLIVEHVQTHHGALQGANKRPPLRRRSVLKMLKTFNRLGKHPDETRRLSLEIFDLLMSYHGLNKDSRELLEYSALLHDIGVAIHKTDHNRHSAYLIRHGELRGFTREEREVMALAVLLHRDERTGFEQSELSGVRSEQSRRQALVMAAILRLADALDRAQSSNVVRLRLKQDGAVLRLKVYVQVETGLEAWAFEQKADLFEAVLGHKIVPDVRIDDATRR